MNTSKKLDVVRARQSVCFVVATHRVGDLTVRTSGTAFLVREGWVATNRHVLDPSTSDPDVAERVRAGEKITTQKLVAYFPGSTKAVPLLDVKYASTEDLALARLGQDVPAAPLQLAAGDVNPGEAVTVVGYPLGTKGMVVKSPAGIYQPEPAGNSAQVAAQMASQQLVRPFATFGHVGDRVGTTVTYDAATAHGGSGGPVLNERGEVVAINAAYIPGFSGGSVGITASALRELLDTLR